MYKAHWINENKVWLEHTYDTKREAEWAVMVQRDLYHRVAFVSKELGHNFWKILPNTASHSAKPIANSNKHI